MQDTAGLQQDSMYPCYKLSWEGTEELKTLLSVKFSTWVSHLTNFRRTRSMTVFSQSNLPPEFLTSQNLEELGLWLYFSFKFPHALTLTHYSISTKKVGCFQTLCPPHEMVGECSFKGQQWYEDFLSLTYNQNHLIKTQDQYQWGVLSAMCYRSEK